MKKLFVVLTVLMVVAFSMSVFAAQYTISGQTVKLALPNPGGTAMGLNLGNAQRFTYTFVAATDTVYMPIIGGKHSFPDTTLFRINVYVKSTLASVNLRLLTSSYTTTNLWSGCVWKQVAIGTDSTSFASSASTQTFVYTTVVTENALQAAGPYLGLLLLGRSPNAVGTIVTIDVIPYK
jgi:hypothetical protein